VAIDVPQGACWLVQPKGGLFSTSILGDEARKGPSWQGADFKSTFRILEQALPPATQALLWSLGERSYRIKFSPRVFEVAQWPSDVVEHKPSSFSGSTIWEGGYDVNELAVFVDQACALAASLLIPAERA